MYLIQKRYCQAVEAILDTRVRSKTFDAIIEADVALADIQVCC